MEEIHVVLGLLVAIALFAALARRVGVPYPILMVVGGLLLGLIPGLPHVELPPELVLTLFLPPILFAAAYFTSLRDLRANARPIGLLAVGLVLTTSAAVAAVVHWLVPSISWAAAFALGAIVSPPDAIAVTALAQRLSLPARTVVILEGESLVNDATALVAYRMAVGAIVAGTFALTDAAIQLVLVAAGGVVIGLAVGWLVVAIMSRLDDIQIETAVSFIGAFGAYLAAEQLGVSGVLAAVVGGLYVGRRSARVLTSEGRLLGGAVWSMAIFLINGFVFVLIGLQLPSIVESAGASLPAYLGVAAVVSIVVVAVRIAWVYPATYLPRLVSASVRRRDPSPSWRHVFVVAWAGMRGSVSLAAALALPTMATGGQPFPHRDLIIFCAFAVILVTLVGQGLSLPWLIRRLGVSAGDGRQDLAEETHAREVATDAARLRIEGLFDEWPTHRELIEQLRARYEHRAEHILGDGDAEADTELVEHRQIRQDVIRAERMAVIDLRDRGLISDEVLRRIERELDLEELRMEA